MINACPRRWPLRLAGLLLLGFSAPAQALEYGGWYGRATLDGWHDDNLARGRALDPAWLPSGNQDLGGDLGLALGSVWLLAPALDLWVTANGHASRAWRYPDASGASLGLFTELSWHRDADTQAYISAGASHRWGAGLFYLADMGLQRRMWPGGWLHAATALGMSQGDRPALRYALPSVSVGVQQGFEPGTRVSLSYGYQQRHFERAATEAQHQLFLLAAQRLDAHLELRTRYALTLGSTPNPFRSGLLTFGLAYYL